MKISTYASLLACLFVAGCNKGDEAPTDSASPVTKPTASAPTDSASPSASASADASPSPSASAATNMAPVTEAEISNIPFYPGSKPSGVLGGSRSDDDTMSQTSSGRLTSDSLEKVEAFYKDALPKVGCKVEASTIKDKVLSMQGGTPKKGAMFSLTMFKDPDSPQYMISINYTVNKKW